MTKIVIDIQGFQSESKYRGIGRYSLGFTKSIIKSANSNEVILLANGLLIDDLDQLYKEFEAILPRKNIRIFDVPGPVRKSNLLNEDLGKVAELIREEFIKRLNPDVVHITSLFEGYIDDAITSIGLLNYSIPVTTTVYDLIPLVNEEIYLEKNPIYRKFYLNKIKFLQKSQACFAISESTMNEVSNNINIDERRIINIGTGIDVISNQIDLAEAKIYLKNKHEINKDFILYTGGSDDRKNLKNLIKAFALIESELRDKYLLVIVGKMLSSDVDELFSLAEILNIKKENLLSLGYVSDRTLNYLYSTCYLYVMPSWHEGFGLPILEAMLHGAPVICSNTSSMREVHGLGDALFNPFDPSSIATKIKLALTNNKFREILINHASTRVEKFSWNSVAEKAWDSWDNIYEYENKKKSHYINGNYFLDSVKKLTTRMNSSKLQNLSCSISQNLGRVDERQLFLDISELSQRDGRTGVQRVVRGYLKSLLENPPKGFKVHPVYATISGGYKYANEFTSRFLGLSPVGRDADSPILWQRGDIFLGLDLQHHVQLSNFNFYKLLMEEGVIVKFIIYDLLPIQLEGYFSYQNHKKIHEDLMRLIAKTNGAICISRATKEAYNNWLINNKIETKKDFQLSYVHIGGDLKGSVPSSGMMKNSKEILSKIKSKKSFLVVSTIEPRKGHRQILEAFEILWEENFDANLIFVGVKGWGSDSLINQILGHKYFGERLIWLDGISDEYLEKVYETSHCLIIASLNEGFGLPIIESAKYELPIIARDIPVFREIAGSNAHYFEGTAPLSLSISINKWVQLEQNSKNPRSNQIKFKTWEESTEALKAEMFVNYKPKQIFLDISELVQKDAGSGIQRVVRNLLLQLLKNSIEGYIVCAVYATTACGYRYARNFTNKFVGKEIYTTDDEIIDYQRGDIFFGLDMQPQVVEANKSFYSQLRRNGVIVKFMLYDLLPIQFPQFFYPGTDLAFKDWLNIILNSDGVICISQEIKQQLEEYQRKLGLNNSCDIDFSYLGFELDQRENQYSKFLKNRESLISSINQLPCFLMVGTIEPRKAHQEVIKAFEKLWKNNIDINLLIVGKLGWLSESVEKSIKTSAYYNKRLYWLDNVCDSELELIYKKSACLIAASHGEGFGLPLIEAAHYELSIIARNIKIFKEIAEENVLYFDSEKLSLESVIINWLDLKAKNCEPKSSMIKKLSWMDSAKKIAQLITKSN